MKIEIKIGNSNTEKIKKIEIPTEKIIKGVIYLNVFSFMGKQVMRVRPPKRGAGALLNLVVAGVVTDAVMNLAFPKKKACAECDKEVVMDSNCEPYSEVIDKEVTEETSEE